MNRSGNSGETLACESVGCAGLGRPGHEIENEQIKPWRITRRFDLRAPRWVGRRRFSGGGPERSGGGGGAAASNPSGHTFLDATFKSAVLFKGTCAIQTCNSVAFIRSRLLVRQFRLRSCQRSGLTTSGLRRYTRSVIFAGLPISLPTSRGIVGPLLAPRIASPNAGVCPLNASPCRRRPRCSDRS